MARIFIYSILIQLMPTNKPEKKIEKEQRTKEKYYEQITMSIKEKNKKNANYFFSKTQYFL